MNTSEYNPASDDLLRFLTGIADEATLRRVSDPLTSLADPVPQAKPRLRWFPVRANIRFLRTWLLVSLLTLGPWSVSVLIVGGSFAVAPVWYLLLPAEFGCLVTCAVLSGVAFLRYGTLPPRRSMRRTWPVIWSSFIMPVAFVVPAAVILNVLDLAAVSLAVAVLYSLLRFTLRLTSYTNDPAEDRPWGYGVRQRDRVWRLSYRAAINLFLMLVIYGIYVTVTESHVSNLVLSLGTLTAFTAAMVDVSRPTTGGPGDAFVSASVVATTFLTVPMLGWIVATALRRPELPHADFLDGGTLIVFLAIAIPFGGILGAELSLARFQHLGGRLRIAVRLYTEIGLPLAVAVYGLDLLLGPTPLPTGLKLILGLAAYKYALLPLCTWLVARLSAAAQPQISIDALTEIVPSLLNSYRRFALACFPSSTAA